MRKCHLTSALSNVFCFVSFSSGSYQIDLNQNLVVCSGHIKPPNRCSKNSNKNLSVLSDSLIFLVCLRNIEKGQIQPLSDKLLWPLVFEHLELMFCSR